MKTCSKSSYYVDFHNPFIHFFPFKSFQLPTLSSAFQLDFLSPANKKRPELSAPPGKSIRPLRHKLEAAPRRGGSP